MKGKTLLAIFIAIIMVSSILGIVTLSDEDGYSNVLKYHGNSFNYINGKYFLELDGSSYVFDNSPYELEDISFEDFVLESDKYYILFNPEDMDNNFEYFIQKLFLTLNSKGVNVQIACDREEGCDETFPIRSCEDYSFYLKKEENTKIYKDNNCIVLEGDNSGLNRAVDKVNLEILNI